MALYNTTRYLQGLLKEYEDAPPSFTVRLYREHWILNNSTKFLYNNQMAVRIFNRRVLSHVLVAEKWSSQC